MDRGSVRSDDFWEIAQPVRSCMGGMRDGFAESHAFE